MEYIVCTASLLMSVLECIVSIEINMFILISSRSNHLISNARAYMDQKSINDRALFSGLIKGFETYSNLLIIDHSADPLCINFQSVNIMIEIGYFPWVCILKAYMFLAIVSDAFVLSHAYLMVRWRWGGGDVNS